MPIEFEVESLDSVDEGLRAAYDERDGKHYFNADKYADLKAAGLKKNSVALKAEKDKLKREYDEFKKKFADFGDDDLKAFAEWKERQSLGGDDDDAGEGDDTKKKQQKADDLRRLYQDQLKTERQKLTAQKDAEIAQERKDKEEWQGKFRRERLTNRLTMLAAESGVFKEELETFVDLMLFKKHFDLTDDEEVVFIENGEPSAITPEKAMAETLYERYGRFYQSRQKGGSGSTGGGAGRGDNVDWKKLPPEERIAYGRRHNTARA
jgi:hypothetical protein